MAGEVTPDDGRVYLPMPDPARGPCEECRQNRARLIGLAADVAGLRRISGRIDGLVADQDRIDRLESTVWAVVGAMLFILWVTGRRENG